MIASNESPTANSAGRVTRGLPILLGRGFVGLIRAYQLVRAGRVSPCRFTPTCSQYTAQAIERYGPVHGVALGVRRLARCRPLGPSGYDPIPE